MAASKSALSRSSHCLLRTPSVIVGYRRTYFSCRNFVISGEASRTTRQLSNRLLSFPSNLQGQRTLHHHSVTRHTAWTTKPVRWYSSNGQGGGASGGGGGAGGGGGRKGFFQNFFDNLRKGVEKNQEIQDSLKGFHEEREKLHQSYVAQQARLKLAAAVERMRELGQRGMEGLKTFKDSSSKVQLSGTWPIHS